MTALKEGNKEKRGEREDDTKQRRKELSSQHHSEVVGIQKCLLSPKLAIVFC